MKRETQSSRVRRALSGMVARDRAEGRTPIIKLDRLASAPSLRGIPRASLRRVLQEEIRNGHVVRLMHGRFAQAPKPERPLLDLSPDALAILESTASKGYARVRMGTETAEKLADPLLRDEIRSQGYIVIPTAKGDAWIVRPDHRRL